jgi:hypothetical protein
VLSIFHRVRVVLVETSHPGNVGSVARAMKTMGFGAGAGSLVLVNPREPDVLNHPDAVAMASGAGDVLVDAQIVPDIESALAGAAYTVAMTARQREFGPPRLLPRDAAARGYEVLAAAPDAVIAFVFGIWVLGKALIFGDPVRGYPSLMVVVLLLGGVQLVALGVIGEYLGRLYVESKQRPLYLVDEYHPPHGGG